MIFSPKFVTEEANIEGLKCDGMTTASTSKSNPMSGQIPAVRVQILVHIFWNTFQQCDIQETIQKQKKKKLTEPPKFLSSLHLCS
ncbi:hypothetical protein M8J77_022523 [Diaphorina citri]|nr:hypothetical protein M8J77_022523 [Diaphorina citri]